MDGGKELIVRGRACRSAPAAAGFRGEEGADGSGGRASSGCLNKGRLCWGAESRLVLLGQEEQGEGESITEPSVSGKKVLTGFKCVEG